MDIDKKTEKFLANIANNIISAFKGIEKSVNSELSNPKNISYGLISNNTWTANNANKNLSKIKSSLQSSYSRIKTEPAICRVSTIDEDGENRIYYICRGTPVNNSGVTLASYNSPVGRMASLPIGEYHELPNSKILEITENTKLFPQKSDGEWDSINTVIESNEYKLITIKSLRTLISSPLTKDDDNDEVPDNFDEDLLKQILAKENHAENVRRGFQRSVLEKIGIRDQPILDQYQDEIFRLPINNRLLLLGPPGTGKTTTLIRRLAQKNEIQFLTDEEQLLIESSRHNSRPPHEKSWIMFTPTELLRIYLKEAFAREGVPASDQNIKTWSDFRKNIARNSLHLLKSNTKTTGFILKENLDSLKNETLKQQIEWCEDFESWHHISIKNELSLSADFLSQNKNDTISKIGYTLSTYIKKYYKKNISNFIIYLDNIENEIIEVEKKLTEEISTKIDGTINFNINKDKDIFKKIAEHLDQINQQNIEAEDIEEEDFEEDPNLLKSNNMEAVKSYRRALRAQALATFTQKNVNPKTKTGQLLEWLGERTLKSNDQSDLGSKIILLSHIRKFKNPLNRYLININKKYKEFRKERQKDLIWYKNSKFKSNAIHPLEIDIIIYSILNTFSYLLRKKSILNDIENKKWNIIHPIYLLNMNQVYVDEATDFSPIQIACMNKLCHSTTKSFFACGDFNQRLTKFGSRDLNSFRWGFTDIDVKTIDIVYRQSLELNNLACAIISAVNKEDSHDLPQLPKDVTPSRVKPVLLENEPDIANTCNWLCERICEVENMVNKLPSIAIFVTDESKVRPIAEELNNSLEDTNIQAIACFNGQVMGNESDVRVFDIQHIKGLEFEAVFFIDIDHLANEDPDLFDKYIYVGATRAATYLGITCKKDLPDAINSTRHHFAENWQYSAIY